MTEELVIGCPVYKRGWILPRWFEHAEKAAATAGVQPAYAFVVDDRDDGTLDALADLDCVGYIAHKREVEEHAGTRRWGPDRYRWMVELRNELLGVVRTVAPRLFLSLDSDVLLHPEAIKNMMETIERCDAVGGKLYMTEMGTSCPSWARVQRDGGLFRQDSDYVFPVQVIMAVKLMRPEAYNVDYEYAVQGEDIGWSLACGRRGLKFLWDARVANKHVMDPRHLDLVDRRVGF